MDKIITYAYLRAETDISKNVANDALDNPIKWAQDQAKHVLGRDFWDQIYTQASTNPTTLSTDNAAMFDPYLKQFLAFQAYEYYISRADTYESASGLRTHREGNSEPASTEQINIRRKEAQQRAQFYKGALVSFLIGEQNQSASKYPLFDCGSSRMGSGFGITGVSKTNKINIRIDSRTQNNGY